MRDLLLTSVFSIWCIQALRHTWIGVMLWTWLSMMNPHRLTYGFAFNLPFAQIAAVVTLLSILWSRGKVRLPRDATVVLLIIFVAWMSLTTAFAILPNESFATLIRVLKIQLMTLVCMAAIRERKHIEWFVWINVLAVGFYGAKGGIFSILTGGGYRVWGPPDSFIEDNNALGLALVMIIPLGYYLWQVSIHRWLRHALLVFLLLCAVSALSTQSRGAFLAIFAMVLMLWTRTRRKFASGVVIVLLGVLMIAFMPENWEERMRSIQTYEQDSSAMQRINAWHTAVNIAADRITGAGFAVANPQVFARYSPAPEWIFTAHSIYFQALGEHGWIGLLVFLALGVLTFSNAAEIRRRALQRTETFWAQDLCAMIQVSMVGFAVGGAFLSLTYFDLPYNVMVMVVACKHWLREERWRDEKTGVFKSTSAIAVASGRLRTSS